jgi:hypothetical protein
MWQGAKQSTHLVSEDAVVVSLIYPSWGLLQ